MMTDIVQSAWGGLACALLGVVLGRLLVVAVGRWFALTDEPMPAVFAAGYRVEAGAAIAAVALWWWEVQALGQMPADVRPTTAAAQAVSATTAFIRVALHMVLFWLLAAATWIDLRQRVIPDWITVPGVLAGLLVAWAFPDALPPILVEVPRSFAAPAVEPDVLGFLGGLRTVDAPGWLGGAPHAASLLLSAALFAVWWLVCTEPQPVDSAGRRFGMREALLAVGLAAITAAWLVGGRRFLALESALVGMAVSGGIVWATRAGASRALGREAMGLGDVTLMAMVGAWLGWQPCVLVFFLATFLGLAHGLFQLLRHKENELPFGPSLCLAAALVVVAWRPIWLSAAPSFAEPVRLAAVVAAVVSLTALTLFVWRLVRERLMGADASEP
jgi:leader peptidase (prepilin peptidase)/N-methyltransferase